jgi:hypothetical protein
VLSTRLPELENVEGPLRLAVSREEFRNGLRELLRGGPGLDPEEAVAASRANTWDRRVEQLSDFLEHLVPTRA